MFLKRIFFLLMTMLPFLDVSGQSFTIVTYNIRLETSDDGINSWPFRKTWLCDQIKLCGADIFCIQEGLPQQIDFIDSAFAGFRHLGVGRDDGIRQGEFSAIFYNTHKFNVLEQSTFWLSATPGKPSLGWDAACKRICTYGLFQEISTGRKFWVFNTHFDHIGVEARKNSATLILEHIKTLNKNGYPVILTGDFNSGPESEPVKIITRQFQDSKSSDKSMTMEPDGTFNGFDATKPATERIDFIFTGYGAIAGKYYVIRESRDGRYASDHFPVVAEIRFTASKKP